MKKCNKKKNRSKLSPLKVLLHCIVEIGIPVFKVILFVLFPEVS